MYKQARIAVICCACLSSAIPTFGLDKWEHFNGLDVQGANESHVERSKHSYNTERMDEKPSRFLYTMRSTKW